MRSFFQVVSVREVVDKLMAFAPLNAETVALDDADGRLLAEAVRASEDLPLASRSSMDGYAVRAEDCFGASDSAPAYLECVDGVAVDTPIDRVLEPGECVSIVTGGVLPEGADAVVMVEHTLALEGDESADAKGGGVRGSIEIRRAVAPGENVMLRGEDVAAGAEALPSGLRLRPQEVGLLAALGVTTVQAVRRPHAAVLSTGDEVAPVTAAPRVGQVRDVNGPALAAMIRRVGAQATPLGVVPDDAAALERALRDAVAAHDVVFLSGGSSIGARDFTLEIVQRLPESELLCHGVAMRPGKPLVLARTRVEGRDVAVFGLPGQVTSAQVVMHALGLPFLRRLSGEIAPFGWARRAYIPALMARNVASKQGREDYIRVRLRREGATLTAEPVLGASGLLRTLIQADGLVRIPAGDEGLPTGAPVMVCPLWGEGAPPEAMLGEEPAR